jgi:hypothetical protein
MQQYQQQLQQVQQQVPQQFKQQVQQQYNDLINQYDPRKLANYSRSSNPNRSGSRSGSPKRSKKSKKRSKSPKSSRTASKSAAKFAGKKIGKLALGPVGLAIDWIPYISKTFMFSVAADYMRNPKGMDWKYFLIMLVSIMSVTKSAKTIMDTASHGGNILTTLPSIFWAFYYGVILLFYGIPTDTESNNFATSFVKSTAVFLASIYGILSAIIPLILLGTLIPGLNFIVVPLGYIVNIASLVL